MTEPVKCLGLFGWMFGHKFVKNGLDYLLEGDYCFRCGTPKGASSRRPTGPQRDHGPRSRDESTPRPSSSGAS